MTPIRISSGLREQETVSRIHRSRQRKNLLKYDQPHEVIILYPTASRSPPLCHRTGLPRLHTNLRKIIPHIALTGQDKRLLTVFTRCVPFIGLVM